MHCYSAKVESWRGSFIISIVNRESVSVHVVIAAAGLNDQLISRIIVLFREARSIAGDVTALVMAI